MGWVRAGNRLAMYGGEADQAFWSQRWASESRDLFVKQARNDKTLLRVFQQYLPKQGHILEAGCGLGQWVEVLREDGYDVEGIDWSAETIQVVRSQIPTLPVTVGDVRNIKRADSYYAAAICLGVVEHFEEGPHSALHEFRRVLLPDAILLVSVPYFSPLRRIRASLGICPSEPPSGQQFYQYAFQHGDFSQILRAAQFLPIRMVPYAPIHGLRELGITNWVLRAAGLRGTRTRRFGGGLSFFEDRQTRKRMRALYNIAGRLLRSVAGHMMLFVAANAAKKTE